MEKLELTFSKDSYEEILKYQGDPPCYTCIVRAMCFSETINRFGCYDVLMNGPCDEGQEWIEIVDGIYYFVDTYKKLPVGLLGIEDIKTIIQLGENENIDDLARKINVNDAAMESFKDCVNELYELLDIFYADEIIQGFIKPFIEDQFKIIEDEKA